MNTNSESLIVVGDCQARILHSTLREITRVTARYDVHYLSVEANAKISSLTDDVWERCTVLWLQIGSEFLRASRIEEPLDAISDRLTRAAKIVRFPAVWLRILWPNHRWDTLYEEKSDDPGFFQFPYSDSVLMELSKTELCGPELTEAFERRTAETITRLDFRLEREAQMIIGRDLKVDVPMGGFILSNFRAQRLFYSYNHPTQAVIRLMLDRLISATWPEERNKFPQASAENAPERLDEMRMYDYPVAHSVAQRLGLQWWSQGDLYLSQLHSEHRFSRRLDEYVTEFVSDRRRRMRSLPV